MKCIIIIIVVWHSCQTKGRKIGLDSRGAGNRGSDAVFQLADKYCEFDADQNNRRQKKILDNLAVKLNVGR